MVGGAGGWSTAARQPQPERCQLWRRRPLAARSGATARTSTQSAARGAALRRHGWHGHARCGACAGYGSSFFQVKSAYLTAKTPKISRLARRARGALRRLARLRRAGSQVYSFSDIGSKCFTYSENHSPIGQGLFAVSAIKTRRQRACLGCRLRARVQRALMSIAAVL